MTVHGIPISSISFSSDLEELLNGWVLSTGVTIPFSPYSQHLDRRCASGTDVQRAHDVEITLY